MVYTAARTFLVTQLAFLAAQMMKYSEETDYTETVQNITDWRRWRTLVSFTPKPGGLEPALVLALPFVVLAQAPAGSCCGWEDGAENKCGDTGAPRSTLKAACLRKVRFCVTLYWSSGSAKTALPVLQACSPTTRTHTAIGSAALSAITILNSDWLELYPFMCAKRC